jgi:hypothetical protein
VTVYWVKLDDLAPTQKLPQRTLAGRPLEYDKQMLEHGGRDISGPFLSQSSHSEPQQQRSCWWVFTLSVSDSLRNSRAGSRTIYQHGADVNVLFERRVAVVNTQSQHRPRKKWWIGTTSCAGAIGWPHRCSALEKYRSDGKKFARMFF